MKKDAGLNVITIDEIKELKTRFDNLTEHL
jgi:hypothetical protein